MRQNSLLQLFIGFLAISQVACSKGQSQQCDMACMQFYNSLLQNNPQTKAVAQKTLNEVLASSSNGGTPMTGASPSLGEVLKNSGVNPASVTPDMLKAHAASVKAALEADRHNPESPFYEPPASDMAARETASVSIAAPSSPAEESAAPPTSNGGASMGGSVAR